YTDILYEPGSFLVFGKETKGLPPEILGSFPDSRVRIPMIAGARSLNLSNSVAVVLFEALRQQAFPGLK
ncbi:MAG: TrmH family RNA methyltransferase, partial [Desulfotomaculaceae bacterium]|nr:TrmH family RNA methyltransferase [Desulfotomaculaceae bacterium]